MGSKALVYVTAGIGFLAIGDALQHQVKNMGSPVGVQGSDFTNGDIEHVRFPDSMQRVLDIVRSVESMPSCAKIATSNLMHSCSSLEGSILNEDAELNRGSDLFIADEMGLYAARLAVCELNEAGSTIPNGCEAFVPSQGMKKQSGFRSFWTRAGPTNPTPCYGCYDDVTQAQSKQCINALYSVPQTWTSFSNSKQNAVTICRAMRSEIDREEQVHISEILAETAVAATDNLRDAYKQANQVKAQFEEIRSALPKFHQDLVDGNEMLLMQVKQLWTELQQGLNAISDIRNNVQAANEDINNLHSSIKAATDESLATVHEGLHGMESQVTIMFGTLQSLHTTMNFEAEYGSNLIAQVLSAIARNMSLAHGETSLIAEQTREKLLELNATMSSFPMVLAAEWAGAHEWLQAMKTFSSYVVVYTLLGFGVWEKFMRFSIVGSIFASLGSGIALASVSTTMPINFTALLDHIPDSAQESHTFHVMFFGFVIVAICYCAFVTVKSIVGHASSGSDGQDKKHGPASPTLPLTEK